MRALPLFTMGPPRVFVTVAADTRERFLALLVTVEGAVHDLFEVDVVYAPWRVVDAAEGRCRRLQHRQQHGRRLVVDEAFQANAVQYYGVGDLADRHLLMGDSGQLAPFTTAPEGDRWRGLDEDPLLTAVPVSVRTPAQVGTYDNGESWQNLWDPNDAQAWQSINEHYNVGGSLTFRITTWDDGTQTNETFGGAAPLAEEGAHRPLEVDRVAGLGVAEVGAAQRLVDDVGFPPPGADVDDGEAATVHRDRVAELGFLDDGGGGEPEAAAIGRRHSASG